MTLHLDLIYCPVNIFIVKKGEISTPPVAAGMLDGITRRVVIDLAREAGYTLMERELSRYDLYTADEVFLTGTAAEVIPVRVYDEREIGDGKPGADTKKLMKEFRKMVESTGTSIY